MQRDGQTNKQKGRQADKQTYRQTSRQTSRQAARLSIKAALQGLSTCIPESVRELDTERRNMMLRSALSAPGHQPLAMLVIVIAP